LTVRRSTEFDDDVIKLIDNWRAKRRPIPNFTVSLNTILREAL